MVLAFRVIVRALRETSVKPKPEKRLCENFSPSKMGLHELQGLGFRV